MTNPICTSDPDDEAGLGNFFERPACGPSVGPDLSCRLMPVRVKPEPKPVVSESSLEDDGNLPTTRMAPSAIPEPRSTKPSDAAESSPGRPRPTLPERSTSRPGPTRPDQQTPLRAKALNGAAAQTEVKRERSLTGLEPVQDSILEIDGEMWAWENGQSCSSAI